MRPQWLSLVASGTIASRVRALVVVCIVPAWLLAVVVIYQSHQREREALVRSTVSAARALARSVDRELATSVSMLQTLAQSPLIDDRDYPRFHRAGQSVLRQSGSDNIVLLDTELRGLVSLAHAPEARFPRLPHDRFPQVLVSRRPAVSDLFVGQVSRRPQVAAAVPVLRDDQAIGRLEMVFTPERIATLLRAQAVPEGWIATIVDRQGVLVARNQRAEEFVGKPATERLRQAIARADEGHFANRALDGTPVVACFSRSPETGWTAVIAMPQSVLEAELRQSLLQQAAGALVLLGLGLAAAQWLGRRLARPVQSLVQPALAIGRGATVPIARSGLREADELAEALTQASRLLSQRQQAREQAERSLRDSEARLRRALDVAQIGDWNLDLRSGQLTHSLRHDQCLGYAEPVADWTLERLFDQVHPEDRARIRAAWDRALATRTPFLQELRVLWPDGSLHWTICQGLFIEDRGELTHVQGLLIDITDRKHAEELRLNGLRLEAENRQILEASRLKNEFLANMSHELRTPLNAVIGFADILAQADTRLSEAKRAEYLRHIGDSGRHLLRMINDVLDLSKVEAGRFEIHPEPLQLTPLLNDVCGVLQVETTRKRLTLQTSVDPAVESLVLDPARLKQMLYNYLSNAIKFTPEGGRIALRARAEDDDTVRIEVEDTGRGIAAQDMARLFVPFQQLHSGPTKRHAGTGLGLALTRRLAELHGGSAGVRSAPGEGSVFHLRLPRQVTATARA